MAHHEPFKALGPLAWDTILACPKGETSGDADAKNGNSGSVTLSELLNSTFESARILVDSIPSDTGNSKTKTTGRARSQTDSAVGAPPPHLAGSAKSPHVPLLRKEWKEVKVSPSKDNKGNLNNNLAIYKLSARDGKGSWFARRSVHERVGFDKFRLGLRREFAETTAALRQQQDISGVVGKENGGSGHGDGKSVRGLGAEKRIERRVVKGVGTVEVFLVSVRFPGPTTPRDFVTVLLMPEDAETEKMREREFMVVSRPCECSACPPRQGFIRGTYESVELIREIKVAKTLRRTKSSLELHTGDGVRATARRAVAEGGTSQIKTASSSPTRRAEEEDEDEDEDVETAVEWLMVTRSDPGGSVPRFMVEKGTPGGITTDAGRFLDWIVSKDEGELRAAVAAGFDELDGVGDAASDSEGEMRPSIDKRQSSANGATLGPNDVASEDTESRVAPPTGFYGMIASALEAAGSVVISRMSSLAGSVRTDSEQDDGLDSESDASSQLSYASAEEGEPLERSALNDIKDNPSLPDLASSALSVRSTLSSGSQTTGLNPGMSADQQLHVDKELRKLQERRRRANEKMAKAQEKLAAKRRNDSATDKDLEAQEAALAKLREKHEREVAKQEEKFQRDLVRLQEKRAAERRKADDRRRKADEREARRNLQAELEKVRAERDVARREIEILKEQVGALQSQNTMLVARLGSKGSLSL